MFKGDQKALKMAESRQRAKEKHQKVTEISKGNGKALKGK